MATSSICAFKSVSILPAYGKNICRINWILKNEFYDFTKFGVNVYKSRDGYTDWFKLTNVSVDPETGMITDISTGESVYLNKDANSAVVTITAAKVSFDINFKNKNQTFIWHYKCELIKRSDNSVIDTSPAVSMYNTLKPDQFASLRMAMKNDLLSNDYQPFYICRPKGNAGIVENPNNSVSKNIDLLSGDQIGAITDTTSLGKIYSGGFSNPIKTYFIINSINHQHIDNPEGQGSSDEVIATFSGLYYPKLIVGDMIVNKETDDRYLFESYQQEFYLMGKVPYKFIGIMRLIPRNQIEYKFDLSNIQPCLDS